MPQNRKTGSKARNPLVPSGKEPSRLNSDSWRIFAVVIDLCKGEPVNLHLASDFKYRQGDNYRRLAYQWMKTWWQNWVSKSRPSNPQYLLLVGFANSPEECFSFNSQERWKQTFLDSFSTTVHSMRPVECSWRYDEIHCEVWLASIPGPLSTFAAAISAAIQSLPFNTNDERKRVFDVLSHVDEYHRSSESREADLATRVTEIQETLADPTRGGRDEAARSLLLFSSRVLLGKSKGSGKRSFDVTENQISVIVSNVTEDQEQLQPQSDPERAMSPSAVVSLLNRNYPVNDIRQHVRKSIAPSPKEIGEALYRWQRARPRGEGPNEKRELADFVNFLGSAYQTGIFWGGQECYLTVTESVGYESGRFLVIPVGSKKPSITRVEFADLPQLSFDRELSLEVQEGSEGTSPFSDRSLGQNTTPKAKRRR